MTFQLAVETTPGLEKAYCSGLQALGCNSQVVECQNMRRIVGSVDIDCALATKFPQDSRWDYGIGVKHGANQVVMWVEVHPASTNEIESMLKKLNWLKSWLCGEGKALSLLTPFENAYHWVSTEAGTHINTNSSQAKRLAMAGLRSPRRRINLCS